MSSRYTNRLARLFVSLKASVASLGGYGVFADYSVVRFIGFALALEPQGKSHIDDWEERGKENCKNGRKSCRKTERSSTTVRADIEANNTKTAQTRTAGQSGRRRLEGRMRVRRKTQKRHMLEPQGRSDVDAWEGGERSGNHKNGQISSHTTSQKLSMAHFYSKLHFPSCEHVDTKQCR